MTCICGRKKKIAVCEKREREKKKKKKIRRMLTKGNVQTLMYLASINLISAKMVKLGTATNRLARKTKTTLHNMAISIQLRMSSDCFIWLKLCSR